VIGSDKDVHVLRGLHALSQRVGRPVGRIGQPVPLQDLYFLWSLERVAMLYDLTVIGDKDWYRWGVESLLANQAKGGWWTGVAPQPEWTGKHNYDYRAALSTAFALLFLKRSHPLKDLTPLLLLKGEELTKGLARLKPGDKYPVRSVTTPAESRNSNR
jgi:hypothetical protein